MRIDQGGCPGCLRLPEKLPGNLGNLENIKVFEGLPGLPGVAWRNCQATPQKTFKKQGCPGCPGCLPLKGSLTGRATPGPRVPGATPLPQNLRQAGSRKLLQDSNQARLTKIAKRILNLTVTRRHQIEWASSTGFHHREPR